MTLRVTFVLCTFIRQSTVYSAVHSAECTIALQVPPIDRLRAEEADRACVRACVRLPVRLQRDADGASTIPANAHEL